VPLLTRSELLMAQVTPLPNGACARPWAFEVRIPSMGAGAEHEEVIYYAACSEELRTEVVRELRNVQRLAGQEAGL